MNLPSIKNDHKLFFFFQDEVDLITHTHIAFAWKDNSAYIRLIFKSYIYIYSFEALIQIPLWVYHLWVLVVTRE